MGRRLEASATATLLRRSSQRFRVVIAVDCGVALRRGVGVGQFGQLLQQSANHSFGFEFFLRPTLSGIAPGGLARFEAVGLFGEPALPLAQPVFVFSHPLLKLLFAHPQLLLVLVDFGTSGLEFLSLLGDRFLKLAIVFYQFPY